MKYQQDKNIFSIVLEGSGMQTIAGFYQQLNDQLMRHEDWILCNSLDAFDDLLYGGFSKWKGFDKLEIIWNDIDKSSIVLGKATTIAYYEEKIYERSPFK